MGYCACHLTWPARWRHIHVLVPIEERQGRRETQAIPWPHGREEISAGVRAGCAITEQD